MPSHGIPIVENGGRNVESDRPIASRPEAPAQPLHRGNHCREFTVALSIHGRSQAPTEETMRSTILTSLAIAGGLILLARTSNVQADPPEKLRLNSWEAKAVKSLERERDARARAEALRQLSRSREVKLLPLLAYYAAYDPEVVVRDAASLALTQLRGRVDRWEAPTFPRVERDAGLVGTQWQDDERKISEAREALGELQTDRKPYRREDAARTLGRIGGPPAIPFLAHAAAYDPDGAVRIVAGRAVEKIREREARWQAPPPPRYDIVPGPVVEPPRIDRTAYMIVRVVAHYLGRNTRPEEIANWQTHFREGGTYQKFLATVLGSDEYYQRCGSDPDRWIGRMFIDMLRRPPSDEEFRRWKYRWQRNNGGGGERMETAREFVDTFNDARNREGFDY
jgi:hypothetical protein